MGLKPENFTNDKWKGTIIILGGILIAGIVVGIFPHSKESLVTVPNEKTVINEPSENVEKEQQQTVEKPENLILETEEPEEDNEYTTPDPFRITEFFNCTRVIDGDTIECEDSDTTITVRMIGIDTPESVAPDESGKTNTEEGEIASVYTKNLLEGKVVYLEFDEERTDEYGRTLAYVYLDALGEEFVNEMLLEEGMAKCIEIEPNTRYTDLFANAQATAEQNQTGFWGTGFFE